MEIDFSSVWSWTLPLWGLVVLIAFLGGALTQETVWAEVHTGGAMNVRQSKKRGY